MKRIQLSAVRLTRRTMVLVFLGISFLRPMLATAQTASIIKWNPVYADEPVANTKRINSFHFNLCGDSVENPVSVAFSNDSQQVCIGNANGNIKHTSGGLFGHFSAPDSIAEDSLASCMIWGLDSGEQQRRIPGHHAWKITAVAFSPDGSMLATTGYQYSYSEQRHYSSLVSVGPEYKVKVWDTVTGEELHSWDKVGGGLVFSSDNNSLICTSSHSGVHVFDVKKGSPPKTWDLRCSDDIPPIRLESPDEVLLFMEYGNAFGSGRHTPTRLNIKTGREIKRFVSNNVGEDSHNDYGMLSAGCNLSSKKLATSTEDSVIIWDLGTGTEIRRIDADISSQALSIDSRGLRLLSVDKSCMLKEFDLETGDLLKQTKLPNGKYRISPNGKSMVYLPEEAQGFWEVVDIESKSPLARFHQSSENHKWAIETADGFEIHSASVEVNEDTLEENAEGVRLCLSILHETESSPNASLEVTTGDEVETSNSLAGKLLILSVGVSEYQFPEYQLAFAKKDAEDISNSFRSQKGALYSDVFLQCITNEDATRENIEKGLEWLSRSCTEKDIAIVFMSGHGITARKGLYFLPWEGDVESISDSCLNWQSIAEELLKCRAGHIVCLLDCCHAGAFSEVRFVTQEEISSTLSGNDRVSIFCSSEGTEKSLEDSAWGNGAFTKALIQGMSYDSDLNKDGRVSLAELVNYTEKSVATLTNERQHPRLVVDRAADNETYIASVSFAKIDNKTALDTYLPKEVGTQVKLSRIKAGTEVWNTKSIVGILNQDFQFQILKQERGWSAGRFPINGEVVFGWVKDSALAPEAR